MLPIKNQNQIIMNKKDLFYHPVSWVVFVFVAISAAYYTYQNFESANPIVSLDIQMDRESALAKAQSLASEFSIGPKGFKQAAAFDRDGRFQTFVELEGGGLDSFTSCIEKGNYYAYYWEVRHFKEHETNEVKFWFTPEGKPLGFSEKIGEAEKGAALSEDEALKVAEHHAAYNWDVDFSLYQIIEKSSEERISGRIDHTFVYEREDISIGEGKFRVKLTVSGDKLSAVDYFVKVPEEFDRRYSEMRSDNDTIATIASGIIFLFYGILGVILGIFFLMRRRSLIWKKPLFWGLAIAMGSVFLLTINNLPISWFSYDTSTSQSNFLFRQLLNGLLGAFGFGAVIAISTMAAEGLGRLAFPKQIQFWKLWSKDAAASKQVLGQSVARLPFCNNNIRDRCFVLQDHNYSFGVVEPRREFIRSEYPCQLPSLVRLYSHFTSGRFLGRNIVPCGSDCRGIPYYKKQKIEGTLGCFNSDCSNPGVWCRACQLSKPAIVCAGY